MKLSKERRNHLTDQFVDSIINEMNMAELKEHTADYVSEFLEDYDDDELLEYIAELHPELLVEDND